MQSRLVQWIYNTSINYLHRQGFEIRCTGARLNKELDKYELIFTYQAREIIEQFPRVDLEHAIRPEPIIKYLCNKANHMLVNGEVE